MEKFALVKDRFPQVILSGRRRKRPLLIKTDNAHNFKTSSEFYLELNTSSTEIRSETDREVAGGTALGHTAADIPVFSISRICCFPRGFGYEKLEAIKKHCQQLGQIFLQL